MTIIVIAYRQVIIPAVEIGSAVHRARLARAAQSNYGYGGHIQ